jgi:hypothetical protein
VGGIVGVVVTFVRHVGVALQGTSGTRTRTFMRCVINDRVDPDTRRVPQEAVLGSPCRVRGSANTETCSGP